MKKSFLKTFALVLTVAMLVAFSSINAFAAFGDGGFFETYSQIPNEGDDEYSDGFWFDVEGLIDETTGEPVVDGGSMRGHPYIPYLRDHGTPKNIKGGDHSPFFGVEDDNTFMNLNPGSYYVQDHPFESSYLATVDIKLDDAFAPGTFAAIRFNVDNDSAATLIGKTEIGLNIAFDVADNTKDTISIGVDGAYYTYDVPDGDLLTWKTFKILDNNEGSMKIFYGETLIALVELSDASGGEYKTVVVKDANGEEKAKKTDACVSANYNNLNFGVEENADQTEVPEGGMHIDNWGIIEHDFDEPAEEPTEAPSSGDPTEAPSDEPTTEPTKAPTAEPTKAPASATKAPASATKAPVADDTDPGTDMTIIIIAIVAAVVVVAVVVVVIVLKKKKA